MRESPATRFVKELIKPSATFLWHAQKRPFDDIRDALRRHVRYGRLKRIHRLDRLLKIVVTHIKGNRPLHQQHLRCLGIRRRGKFHRRIRDLCSRLPAGRERNLLGLQQLLDNRFGPRRRFFRWHCDPLEGHASHSGTYHK